MRRNYGSKVQQYFLASLAFYTIHGKNLIKQNDGLIKKIYWIM